MKLALRREAATNATALHRLFCKLIKGRLVSQFCHGGIVIGDTLYHITATRGPHALGLGEWTPSAWHLVDVGGDDCKAIELFAEFCKPPQGAFKRFIYEMVKGYDWFSLLAFVGPMIRVGWLMYCFELCWLMRRGESPTFRVTPELLILEAAHD